MKKCSICQIDKEESEFPFHNKTKGTLKSWCTLCNRERNKKYAATEKRKEKQREYYQKNKEKLIDRTRRYAENNRHVGRKAGKTFRTRKYSEFIEFKKTLKCIKCGESDHNCLDFHHIDPSDRHDNISNLYHCSKKFKEELKKCVVLCCNCHRKAHAYENFLSDLK